jgi:hypothetical protein
VCVLRVSCACPATRLGRRSLREIDELARARDSGRLPELVELGGFEVLPVNCN